ncbi:hypothetical protein BJQ89_03374 [Arthrobacter sp. ES1]|nr:MULTISPECIES: ATP-binding protein [unclassified Arthrobacter]MCB5283605.1 hypothetical protein [Arthrobacter sp. ES1]WGZ80817.1 ATP-binding protein [Arthrobacter sp. EM1]
MSDGLRRLGDPARDAGWSHEEYLAAVLSREVSECEASECEASGAATRIKAARFPAHKDLEEFNFDHQPSADRKLIAYLGTGCSSSRPKTWSFSDLTAPAKPTSPSGAVSWAKR